MGKFLYDASSFVMALKLERVDLLAKNNVQTLTFYEVLNAFWKEVYLTKTIPLEKALQFISFIREVIKHMYVLDVRGLEEEIFKVALEFAITPYDASYITLAKRNGLILITEDRKLRTIARRIIESYSLEELLSKEN